GKVRQKVGTLEKLRNIWIDNAKRREFMQYLRSQDAEPTALSEVEDLSHIDTFDLLAHLSFKSPLRSREERYKAFMNREGRFLKSFKPEAKEVLEELLDRYRAWGIEEMTSERLFDLSPFKEWGRIVGVSKRFGGVEGLRRAVGEVVERIYPVEEVR
ncbi:MAG: hypothetical protein NZL86_03715, partial [Aquificaceae bacterium]|nr:hypothetical protein [Aquificaceae bacterium]